MKGAKLEFVLSFNLAPTSPWPRNITLRETPTLRVTFCSTYGASWGFAYTKIWYQWQLGKYAWRKRFGSCMRNFNFSTEIVYIVCGLLATQHARRHKEHYPPRGQAVPTNHVRPAVNRQPMFPREMTRRADSACPPTNSHSEFRASYSVRALKTSENIGFL